MREKILKLTNIVYKALDFFPESDPLKNRAKDRALTIMDNLNLINENSEWMSFQNEKLKIQILEDIDIFLGYLLIAKSQGWLSSSNYLIISNEYKKIKKENESTIELTIKLPGIENTKKNGQTQLKENPASALNKKDEEKKETLESFIDISERQKKIIEFLENNEKAQVMNLQTVLPDVTKRTIRRDLDELLEAEKIVRLGDFNNIFYKIK